jgi:ABC-type nitrate/sulfonate/bicarbonate transport system permease component
MCIWIKKYVSDDDGAVTVDWVVITGFVIALTLSVITAISPGMEKRGTEMVDPVTISTEF